MTKCYQWVTLYRYCCAKTKRMSYFWNGSRFRTALGGLICLLPSAKLEVTSGTKRWRSSRINHLALTEARSRGFWTCNRQKRIPYLNAALIDGLSRSALARFAFVSLSSSLCCCYFFFSKRSCWETASVYFNLILAWVIKIPFVLLQVHPTAINDVWNQRKDWWFWCLYFSLRSVILG